MLNSNLKPIQVPGSDFHFFLTLGPTGPRPEKLLIPSDSETDLSLTLGPTFPYSEFNIFPTLRPAGPALAFFTTSTSSGRYKTKSIESQSLLVLHLKLYFSFNYLDM